MIGKLRAVDSPEQGLDERYRDEHDRGGGKKDLFACSYRFQHRLQDTRDERDPRCKKLCSRNGPESCKTRPTDPEREESRSKKEFPAPPGQFQQSTRRFLGWSGDRQLDRTKTAHRPNI